MAVLAAVVREGGGIAIGAGGTVVDAVAVGGTVESMACVCGEGIVEGDDGWGGEGEGVALAAAGVAEEANGAGAVGCEGKRGGEGEEGEDDGVAHCRGMLSK